MKKILITGVAGFIGSNLAERLLRKPGQKYAVIGIDNLSYGITEQVPKKVDFHKLDIRSKRIYPLFKGIDYVFHLAAKNCISDCQSNPLETADINVTGTLNVFQAAIEANVKKVIYAESSAIYEGSSLFPTPESEAKPETFYAASKFCANTFARCYQRFFGLKTTGLRYFNVYGPRQDYRRTIPPVMSAFIIKLLSGKQPIIYGKGDKKRDFVYVDDVNDFHLLCINNANTDGEVFNIGAGKNHSILGIYEMISNIIGVNVSPIHKPELPGEAWQTLADISKARQAGWSPKTSIAQGLNNMADYIKNEIELKRIRLG